MIPSLALHPLFANVSAATLARLEQHLELRRFDAGDIVLRAGVASGEFRPGVAEMPRLAEVVMAPAIMASIWQMILGGEGTAPEPAEMRATHLDLLLAGLSARPGGPGAA